MYCLFTVWSNYEDTQQRAGQATDKRDDYEEQKKFLTELLSFFLDALEQEDFYLSYVRAIYQ
jgi:hypothetical protein